MPAAARDYLAALQADAEQAAAAEQSYRTESAAELSRRQALRERAFRRRTLVAAMVEAATAGAAAPDLQPSAMRAAAIAAAVDRGAGMIGWTPADAAWVEVRARLDACAAALVDAASLGAASLGAGDPPAAPAADPGAAVAALEAWYRERFKTELVDLVGKPATTFESLVDF